jgi:hypothetical protein
MSDGVSYASARCRSPDVNEQSGLATMNTARPDDLCLLAVHIG